MINSIRNLIIKFYTKVNLPLLIFLILLLNVHLIVKVLGLLCMLIWNFKFQKIIFKKEYFSSFYLLLIILAFINFILNEGYFELNQIFAFGVGIFFWTFCLITFWQGKYMVKVIETERIHNTLLSFFLINVIFSFCNLLYIIFETGAINPYQFQGLQQKYFINTGDYIKGITFDTSTTNSLISLFGFIYFYKRKFFFMSILCMIIILLTGSNLTLLITLGILIFLLLFQSNRFQKTIITTSIFMIVIFIVEISPQNNNYAINAIQEIAGFKKAKNEKNNNDSILVENDEEISRIKIAKKHLDSLAAIKLSSDTSLNAAITVNASDQNEGTPVLSFPKADVHAPENQFIPDTTEIQNKLLEFNQYNSEINQVFPNTQKYVPGKILAAQQTIKFLYNNPFKVITGNGMGNFSSKLAFKSTGLNVYGRYPSRFIYINNAFKENHLAVYLGFFTKDASYHSVVNTPNSAYLQLLSEYGVIGLFAFFFIYVAYFLKKFSWRSFGIPLLFALLAAFIFEYWFEQLSIIILFEILAFLCIKEQKLNVD